MFNCHYHGIWWTLINQLTVTQSYSTRVRDEHDDINDGSYDSGEELYKKRSRMNVMKRLEV